MLGGCSPFFTPTDQQMAQTLSTLLANFNNGLSGASPCADSSAYYFDPCTCRCSQPSSSGVVIIDYYMPLSATRVYTICLPLDNSTTTHPLLTISNVLGAVTAYVSDDTGYHLVPDTGFYAPVSASGVVRVTLVGGGPNNFGTIVATDQILPQGVQVIYTDKKTLEFNSGSKFDFLGVYIAVPLALVLIAAVVAIALKLRK